MSLKSITLWTLLAVFVGWFAVQLFGSSRPDFQPTGQASRSAADTESGSSEEPSDIRGDTIPPPIREYGDLPPQMIIDGIRPFVRAFEFPETYCVVEIGDDYCTMELKWKVNAKHRPGQILVYSDTDELVGSGWGGSVQLDLPPGEHTYILSYLTENGQNHMVTSADTIAATASGDILAPDGCATKSSEHERCQMDITLVGFATHVILYDLDNLDNHKALFELKPKGLFTTTYRLDVPNEGVRLGLYSRQISSRNLLAQKTITIQFAQ